MQDVDPGIDHGNSDASVPYEFKKQLVFYRSQQPPGTIIIDTRERYLYLIPRPDTRNAVRHWCWSRWLHLAGLTPNKQESGVARLAPATGND